MFCGGLRHLACRGQVNLLNSSQRRERPDGAVGVRAESSAQTATQSRGRSTATLHQWKNVQWLR